MDGKGEGEIDEGKRKGRQGERRKKAASDTQSQTYHSLLAMIFSC